VAPSFIEADNLYDELKTEAELCLEAGAIGLRGGAWGAVGMKMAAGNLKELRDKIDHDKTKEPSFLMILTPAGYAYRREDGVYVVPIGRLKD